MNDTSRMYQYACAMQLHFSRSFFGFGNEINSMSPTNLSGYRLSELHNPHLHRLTILIGFFQRGIQKKLDGIKVNLNM
jgi:hypothetical protein